MLSFAENCFMSQFYPLQVSSLQTLTPNAVAVSFRVPENLREVFSFTAGQYITIRHVKDGAEIRRAYSLSSKPGEAEITIGVKKVPGGAFSVYANEELSPGDTLEIMPPEGRFTFNTADAPQKIVAFAAGSGITPVMSIIRTVLETSPENHLVLVYGNQSREEAMFYDTLKALEDKYTDRFTAYHLFSRNKEADGMFGRIDKSIVNYITRNKHKDLNPDRYYLCGPLAMIENVTDALKENGVRGEQIYHELFTEPEGEDSLAETLEGNTHLEVVLDDQVFNLDMDQKSIVLDAVLKAKIDAPYSCQGGVCSTCIARVTEGSAKMVKNQILTEGELEEGLILTCQAHPTSGTLKIDYDDV
jgi:ring-1,2-phenylacetyl-CoA epoxidase subunit PaaE